MAKKSDLSKYLVNKLEKAYEDARREEQGELHDALVTVINELDPSIPNAIFVLDLLRFELLQGQYKILVEKVVKVNINGLTPISKVEEKPKE